METPKITITDWKMMSHMSFSNKHQGSYMGKFKCEGLPLDGKILTKHYTQRYRDGRPVGKSDTIFFINDAEPRMFKTAQELLDFYHPTPNNN